MATVIFVPATKKTIRIGRQDILMYGNPKKAKELTLIYVDDDS